MSSPAPATIATYTPAPACPVFTYTASSLANRVGGLVSTHLGAPSSQSSVPLAGYDFPGNLSEAYHLLQSQQYFYANTLFEEIQREHGTANVGQNSLIQVHINIGIAYTLPDNASYNIATATSAAMHALKLVDTNQWKDLEKEQKSAAYLELRSCYKLLLPLIPKAKINDIRDIQTKIDICSGFILPMDEFNEKVREADRCVAKMEYTNARKLYHEALEPQLDPSPIYIIARVTCLLKFASTYIGKKYNNTRDELVGEARNKIEQLPYDFLSSCKQLGWTPEKLFDTLFDLYTKLYALMPEEDQDRQVIQARIEFFKADPPEQDEAVPKIFPFGRKVSRGFPGGSEGPAAIFAKFLILGLAAVGVVSLFRRFVVRVG